MQTHDSQNHAAQATGSVLAEQAYAQLRSALQRQLPGDRSALAMIGIYTGGALVAQRLHRDLELTLPLGFLDSAMYRDDVHARGMPVPPRQSDVPFTVEGAHIILVDDVLYTGRTLRAIINHLFDYGRPGCVELAVLVDRGGRELPMAAQYVGLQLPLTDEQRVVLSESSNNGSLLLEIERVEPGCA